MSRAFDLRSVVTAAILDGTDFTVEASRGVVVARGTVGAPAVPPQPFSATRRLTVAGNEGLTKVDDGGIMIRCGRTEIVVLWEDVVGVQVGRLVVTMLPVPKLPEPSPPRRVGRFTVYTGGGA